MRRSPCVWMAFVAVLAFLALASGCGGAPVSSAPTAGLASSGPTTTGDAAAAAQTIEEMAEYTDAVTGWFRTYDKDFSDEADAAFDFEDPASPTESELLRARQLLDKMRESVDELAKIPAPAEVARAHAQLASALRGRVDALERYVHALEWGSARDIELAVRAAEQSNALYEQALQGLSPYVDLTGTLQN